MEKEKAESFTKKKGIKLHKLCLFGSLFLNILSLGLWNLYFECLNTIKTKTVQEFLFNELFDKKYWKN